MMSEEKSLMPANISPVSLFQKDKLEPFLAKIKRAVDDFKPDVETGGGRKEIAAFAYKISQTKVLIEKAGKALVSKQKAELKLIDNDRKRSKDFLDTERDRARQPLTDYEEAEKKAIAEEAARIEYEADYTEALEYHALYLKEKELEELKAKIEKEAEERREAEEVERLKKEQAEREERLKKEAAAAAKKEAQEALTAEKEKTIRLEVEAKAEAVRAEQAKKDAIEKAERDKKEALENARQKAEEKAAKKEADRRAKEAEEWAEKEVARVAAEKKAAHHNHKKRINNEAVTGFVDIGHSKKEGEVLVTAIAKGLVPNVTINY